MPDPEYEKVYTLLAEYGQTHILKYYDTLNASQKKELLSQAKRIDYALMKQLYGIAKEGESPVEDRIEPISYTDAETLSPAQREAYTAAGEDCLKSGAFAAVTMAGGQGTRLGHSGPKGTYSIGLPGGESLFEIQAKRLLRQSEKSGKVIPWYIMTSRENDAETRDFFEKNNYFGYEKETVTFFVQRMLPMIDFDGKVVLDEKWHIKEGADGHGGIFAAMIDHGVYEDMKRRGIRWIFIGGIDNVLLKLCDPLLIGFAERSGCMAGAKSLVKRDAKEGVGVFCKAGGRPYVIEYTEISEEMANARDDNGAFLYGDAHILCNIFNIAALEKMTENAGGLPYHVAVKKTKYIDENGNTVTPEKPNAYKFEAFIFDAFRTFDDMAILRVKREDEFAPVKNKEGQDSPETAKALYLDAAARNAD